MAICAVRLVLLMGKKVGGVGGSFYRRIGKSATVSALKLLAHSSGSRHSLSGSNVSTAASSPGFSGENPQALI